MKGNSSKRSVLKAVAIIGKSLPCDTKDIKYILFSAKRSEFVVERI